MLKIIIMFIGIIELLIGIINSLIVNRSLKNNDLLDKVDKVPKNNIFITNELISLEGATYIFLASVAIRTNINNLIVILLFIIIEIVFASIIFKGIKKRK